MGAERVSLPVGVVTLLFSDIEGSTRLLQALGDVYGVVLADHRRLLREVWVAHDGVEVDTEGDSFFVAFVDPGQAMRASAAAQRALRGHEWPVGSELRVRMGVHSGSPRVRDGDYWGIDVHYAARLCAAAHGGQVLVSESTAGLVDEMLDDLGLHALKDFPAARRIFHLPVDGVGPGDFPPPRTLRSGQTNLPDQLSSFVGRDAELAQLRGLVERVRLLTLTGAGGVGKTRLAIRLGSELLDGSGDGVWFVDLAPVDDGSLVASRIAEAIGVTAAPGQEALEALGHALSDRRLLIVLDNCEHLVAPAANAVAELLGRGPGISVLATSREPLRIDGEHVYRVPSLSTPSADAADLGELADSEAVQLFVERASQQRSGFALDESNAHAVAGVCRRLDGIPLAIELAAVRLRSMTVGDLHDRLDHRLALLTGGARTAMPRQQTLMALIDWSYQLLSEPEQIVLARLSVFASDGCDLTAAEAVCGGHGIEEFGVLDYLDALVDKSLLQAEDSRGSVRYRLLESVREYASVKLAERGETAAAAAWWAHRDHYLALAETTQPKLTGPDRLIWLDKLSVEHDNLRAALSQCLRDPNPDPGLRLVVALTRFWGVRGHVAEGVAMLSAQLQRADAGKLTTARGRALVASSALLVNYLDDYDTGLAYAEQALEIADGQQDDHLKAEALRRLAWAYLKKGDVGKALGLSERGIATAQGLGDLYLLHGLITGRGAATAILGGDPRPDIERSLELARQMHDPSMTAIALHNLGLVEQYAGDAAAARPHFEEALAIHRTLREPVEIAAVSVSLGFACVEIGDKLSAATLFNDALMAGRDHAPASTVGLALLGVAVTVALPQAAAQLHGAADVILEGIEYSFDDYILPLRDDDRQSLRAELGIAAFEAAYLAGREQRRDDAIALALSAKPSATPIQDR